MPHLQKRHWLGELVRLHERAVHEALSSPEHARYSGMRAQVLSAVLAAQNDALEPERRLRRQPRVQRAVPVRIDAPGCKAQALTFDLGAGGFATLVGLPPPVGTVASVALTLGPARSIHGKARVTAVRKRGRAAARVSFAFDGLAGPGRELLERFLLDTVLAELSSSREVLEHLSLEE
ncbi:PilZ domain-containing protein [Anaeromyxobacter paludicola]|uniref:PilZ domain-containing protein n=1 Tax=Anaeromyxobacter paludicola TaxID=2918171 RepID=A0ABM7XB78_9BACT|nr:PilZ domain-containing protein [Anaeromyxobacter paludicola]BDG09104.1 hypothetical protein AMPC_22170 [Anaeromyxobacter paludicola]